MRRLVPLLLLASCDAGFEDPTIIIDLRVLALRTEPAEVVVDFDPDNPTNVELPTVTVRALVIDPMSTTHTYRFTACPQQNSLRCDAEVSPHQVFGEGTMESGQEEASAALDATIELIEGAVREDPFGGFGGVPVNLELRVARAGAEDTTTIYAAKQLVYAPRLPPERIANQNPTIERLTIGGATFEECAQVFVDTEVRLEPIEPEGVRETYVVPTFDGGQRTFTETMRYAWYATAGDFSRGNTGGPLDAFGNAPPLWTDWRAPEEPATVRLWIVQRDERGGATWNERCIGVTR